MLDSFSKEKSDFLKKKDKSKKGCVDEDIKEIINLINSKKDYYTTSSCSGRIVLLEKLSSKKNESNWLFVKHDKIKFNEIQGSLTNYYKNIKNRKNSVFGNFKIKNFEVIRELPLKAGMKEETCFDRTPEYKNKLASPSDIIENQRFSGMLGIYDSDMAEKRGRALYFAEGGLNNPIKHKIKYPIWLKQEPLILHVRCRDLKSAKKLLDASRKIFKRAGIISLSEKKVVVEIIGTERIDSIIADKDFAADGNYLKNIIKYANRNFEENNKKSKRFLRLL